MSIAQNSALFALLGTTYGGDGVQTFGLPDLRSRVPVHSGNGSAGTGLSSYALGQVGGAENVALTVQQIPSHSHALGAASSVGDTRDPSNAVLAKEAAGVTATYNSTATPDVTLKASSVVAQGGNQPHSNVQPYLALNYCICLYGIFPSRN